MSHCPACGTPMQPDDRFCGGCGAAAPTGPAHCHACGTPSVPNAQFCGQCGAPVGAARPAPPPQAAVQRAPAAHFPARTHHRRPPLFWPRGVVGNLFYLFALVGSGIGFYGFLRVNPMEEPSLVGREPVVAAAFVVALYILLTLLRGFLLICGWGSTPVHHAQAGVAQPSGGGGGKTGLTVGGVILSLMAAGLMRKCVSDSIRDQQNKKAMERWVQPQQQPRILNRP